jgi:hypothetical protein
VTRPTSARRRLLLGLVGLALLALTSGALVLRSQATASADGNSPPPAPTNCPGQQHPPSGYALNGAYYDHTNPGNVESHLNSGAIGYMVPFKGTINGGQVIVPAASPTMPTLALPRIWGAVCGLIALPELTGFIFPQDVVLRSVNAYIGTAPQVSPSYPNSIEALPLAIGFGTQTAGVVKTPAHNGGLDATLGGAQEATINVDGTPGAKPNALGTNCPLKLSVTFSTLGSAQVAGQTFVGKPVTGPVMNGQAEVVANNFPVPAVQPGPTCPLVVAQAVNRLLGLPLPAGRAVFDAPVSFDFEINQPG